MVSCLFVVVFFFPRSKNELWKDLGMVNGG